MQASKLGRAGAVRRLAALARQHQHHVGLARIAGRLAHRQALQGARIAASRAAPVESSRRTEPICLAGRPAAPAPRGRCPARWPAAGTGRPARAAATAPRRPGDAAPAPTPRRRTARWAWAAARKLVADRLRDQARALQQQTQRRVRRIPQRDDRRPADRSDPYSTEMPVAVSKASSAARRSWAECRTPAAHPRARRPVPPTAPPAPVSANGKASAIARDILNAPDITRPRPKHAVLVDLARSKAELKTGAW